MSCPPKTNEESYEFFDNIEDYIKKAKSAESTAASSNTDSICDSFMKSSRTGFKEIITANRICKEYMNLYYSINELRSNLNSDPRYKKCREFLNYWINIKFRENMNNEYDCVHDVYDALESHITGIGDHYVNLFFIYDINKDDMYKMNILYSLYEKYIKLKTIIESTLEQKKQVLPLSTECCTDFVQAKYICKDDKNNGSTFCKKLESFETKYKMLYPKFEAKRSEFSDSLIKLEECSNTKIITTAVTGTVVGLIPLLGVLYKVSELNIKL
ncbi:hypothetical protein PVMG_03653 [Plasmodium vivax Mauritania I]|uniref:PIR Superfamily Protein n=1 Tax=Plasmodium vivax Mauritania I TaxID=1035515 RepID=A0A0J9VXB2_PLAVI|nr:hypothetical protein PVMG_03653 [Plasmodium vivax Mauritania I]